MMGVGEIDTAVFKAALSAAEPVSANLNVFVCYDGVIFATENSAKEYCKDRNFALGGMGYNKKPLQGDFTHPALSAQVQDVAGWQPIETAPTDGTSILLRLSNGEVFSGWGVVETDGSKTWRRFHATGADVGWLNARHWMPLPAVPAKQED